MAASAQRSGSPARVTRATARERLALYVLQLGALVVVLAASPYKQFDLDRFFIPKELTLHIAAGLAAFLLVVGRKRFSLTIVDALLGAFLVISLAATALATNVWVAERALAVSVSGVVLFWCASALRSAGLVRPLLIALAVGVVLCAATALAQAYGVETEFFSLNRAPGGTLGNRNFVAHLSAIGTPVVVLVALTARRGWGSLFGGIAMAVLAAALVMSRSRGAWLAVIVLAVPVAVLGIATWSRWCDARTLRRLVVLAIAAGAGVAGAIFVPNQLNWNSENPYLESATGLVNYKEGSGAGRIVQYTNSLKMAAAHPVLGVGPGNWAVVYPKFASRNDPSMSDQGGLTSNPWPSSDWVAYLSERGVAGFALLVLAMLALLWRAFRDLRTGTSHDAERVLTAIALIGTLIATAVVGAFDAVLLIAVPTYFVWMLAGALAPPGVARFHTGGLHELVPAVVLGAFIIMIGRSAFQFASIATFSTSSRLAAMDRAALFDPGNYRVRVRAAQAYLTRGNCSRARPHARAARDLFPSASQPKRELSACGSR
jgi:O-antigen ligase